MIVARTSPVSVGLAGGTRQGRTGETGPVTPSDPAFAGDPATATYYDQLAAEYDEWYLSQGRFAERERPGWHAELEHVVGLVAALPPARTLDIACGSAFLTRHLRGGLVVGLDQSRAMVALAQTRLPGGLAMVGDALELPFPDGAFDRVLTGHFYGHLPTSERTAFLAEARRVAGELIVIDSALRPAVEPEQRQERVLNDGSRHQIYKRYLTGQQLADELDGEVLLDGTWFAAARTSRPARYHAATPSRWPVIPLRAG
jgi:ubiquinone/menaquinone biosynthesis C-methylase UbiE